MMIERNKVELGEEKRNEEKNYIRKGKRDKKDTDIKMRVNKREENRVLKTDDKKGIGKISLLRSDIRISLDHH